MDSKTTDTALGHHAHDIADLMTHKPTLDIRMVSALAGDRELNAREQATVQKLKTDRGESLFSDMLYALTHKTFPSRQAKTLWGEINNHRSTLNTKLGRDPGITVAAHDYLANVSNQIHTVGLIEETKLNTLTNVATRDGLTGLFDKATFNHHLAEELERKERYDTPFTLLLCDIDHFKKLNDTFGHADGDIVLTNVAEIIQKQCRGTDLSARYGGEEFAIILAGVDLTNAYVFAERLRENIEAAFDNTPYKVTISGGLAEATTEPMDSADTLIRRADAELYKAKNSGRNRICG